MIKDNYTLLVEKLDGFIRKFYINQLLRGALYTVGAVLGLFILLNILEYYLYFGTGVRTGMFWSFLLLSGAALYKWVALPLMHYFHLGKVISHEQAATIIGQHFMDVKDKLLNILQLKQQSSNAIYAELITASINQKSESIRLVPFQSAIDLGKNRKYLRYALPPVLLLMFLLLGAPNILREGTMRLWNARTTYERPAPFRFLINPDSLQAVQFSDYLLKVKVDGQVLPNEVFVTLGNVQYRLTKDAPNEFSYRFVNVQKDIPFQLFAGGVESRDYLLEVLRKPSIVSFSMKLNFPDYLGRASEEMSDVGDLLIPQGTNISWVFNAQSTDQMALRFGNEAKAEAKRFDDDLFSFNRRALRDETYKIFLSNARLSGADSVAYTIAVIPDLHPQIAVEEFKDTTQGNSISFFAGEASDDYGLLNLTFNYQIKKAKSGQLPMNTVKVDKPAGKAAPYEYNWDVRSLDLEPGDEVSYYFEVFDNDGVNGSKSARTTVMQYKMPTMNEFRQQQAQNSEEIKKDLEKALKESAKVQEELKKLRNKVLQQKELDWQSRKEMEKLLDRQKQLEQQIQQAKQNFNENKQQQQEFKQENPELQEKQEQLEKLFDDAMSEEMKKLVEDIQKLLQEMNKEEMLEKMEKMEMNTEEMDKELERLQELYKQLEVEQMVDQQIKELEEMAKKEDELAKQTEDEAKQNEDNKSDEELKKEQEELNKQMEELQKKQEELMEKNEELKRPQEIEDTKEEMEDAKNDMKDAKKEMEGGQKKKASKKQKSASGKMKDMANKMKQKSQSGEMEQMEEDVKALRQLLENLVGLSFAQEKNMKDIEGATINTPRYVELGQQQYKIKDDFKLVEDSLQALASRNFQIEGMVTEKVTEIKSSIKYSIEEIEERRINTANQQQQQSMKSLNDLALMLSEVMEQMQQQMAQGMPGAQACQKPGKGQGKGGGKSGKVPMDKITKGQGDVNQQMKDLKKRMEEQGKNPGGKKPGGKDPGGQEGGGGQGEGTSSQEFAKMAAKQAAMRNALRELQKQKQEQGKGSKALDEIMDDMNKVETDLVNKRLTNEMLQRQEQILSRLLEEERAERERDQDEQRQAEAAKQQPAKMPPALEEYLKKRRSEVEQFRTVSPALKPFYKRMVEDYLKGGAL